MKILRIGCVFGGLLSLALSMPAQTFTQLLVFDQTDGSNPQAPLIQGSNGNFYGTTFYDGNSGYSPCGTIFGMTKSWQAELWCTASLALTKVPQTAVGPRRHWFKEPMEASTGRPDGGGRDNQAYVAGGTDLRNHARRQTNDPV
jgi:hypothetical protein